tara:strand:- start:2861 stop:3184 length:324 start_codon:yes stop_codon:yes gene_type:complete
MIKIDIESHIGEGQNLRYLILDFIDTATDDEDEEAWKRHLETYEALLEEVKEFRKESAELETIIRSFDPYRNEEDEKILVDWLESTTQGFWASAYEYKMMKEEENED